MTHRDASRTQPTAGQADRAAPAGRGPTSPTAARGGFTESELALIHATAEANGLSICVCSVVVPDGTFPPSPDGAPRPEVARILAGLRKDAQAANRPAGFGSLADRSAARSADRPGAGGDGLAVRADAAAPPRAANAVAYDRDAYDLEASRRLAVAGDRSDASAPAAVALVEGLRSGRG